MLKKLFEKIATFVRGRELTKEEKIARLKKKHKPDSEILASEILKMEGFNWDNLSSPNEAIREKTYYTLINLCSKHNLNVEIVN